MFIYQKPRELSFPTRRRRTSAYRRQAADFAADAAPSAPGLLAGRRARHRHDAAATWRARELDALSNSSISSRINSGCHMTRYGRLHYLLSAEKSTGTYRTAAFSRSSVMRRPYFTILMRARLKMEEILLRARRARRCRRRGAFARAWSLLAPAGSRRRRVCRRRAVTAAASGRPVDGRPHARNFGFCQVRRLSHKRYRAHIWPTQLLPDIMQFKHH